MKMGNTQCTECGGFFDPSVMLKCYLPETDIDDEPDDVLCPDCNDGSSYCICCGHFCAGISSFDFGNGYCDNCLDEMDDYDPNDEEEFSNGTLDY